MKYTRKFFTYTFNAFTSRDESELLRKVSDSQKKRYFFQNQKIGCQVRGEATLYPIIL